MKLFKQVFVLALMSAPGFARAGEVSDATADKVEKLCRDFAANESTRIPPDGGAANGGLPSPLGQHASTDR